ncbi:hypothetical protein B0T26DRAFT_655150 [Lasiosphaeria miniovina]|uniref:Post-SET domain-containing protein n=1 Tax=Lasiosphaeria miniovina TaxID=1954250 RepID=A0AA39ZZI3_9PEZI|nr:uncharacterized protein B0T26DRAFT_655150 [Lasiosphaeria miniovina]KAK0706469.1 hypothetical protein B0T26DRAFT_655150 [Lasiosphaeria miniovina]
MGAPIKPHWQQPSHPAVQRVIIDEAEFSSKSISEVAVPPFGHFAALEFPPCTAADEATYATVQYGIKKHLNLNSDLLYINHSCEPSLIFDMANRAIIAGPKGLQPGDELTFFYPSTEWTMAQPFDCLCGTPTCRGRISGADDMTDAQLQGLWLNRHIRQLVAAKKSASAGNKQEEPLHKNGNGICQKPAQAPGAVPGETGAETDYVEQALRDALQRAEEDANAARRDLESHDAAAGSTGASAPRRGLTSRELGGEMGGDTVPSA